MRLHLGFVALSAAGLLLLSNSSLGASQGRRVICLSKDCREELRRADTPEERAARAERERREAEQRRLNEEYEAEYARRRDEMTAAAELSEQRSAEAERVRRMEYDAMVARLRASGCRVPGDPPDPHRAPCVAIEGAAPE
jgi:hypothetical protein